MRLILASSSPRRRDLLGRLGHDFELVEPGADELERLTPGIGPAELVVENARRKARAGLALAAAGEPPVVIGVDTDVFAGGDPLGKPADRAEAEVSLRALSGRPHDVWSGACLIGEDGRERTVADRSVVVFRKLDQATIGLYLDSGEWRGRAGGYAIQGLGTILIERLEGDLSNVIGFPIRALIGIEPRLSASFSDR